MGRTIAEIKQALEEWSDDFAPRAGTLDNLRIRITQELFNLTSNHHFVDVKHGSPGTVIIMCHESVIQTVQGIAKHALPLGALADVVPQEKEAT